MAVLAIIRPSIICNENEEKVEIATLVMESGWEMFGCSRLQHGAWIAPLEVRYTRLVPADLSLPLPCANTVTARNHRSSSLPS